MRKKVFRGVGIAVVVALLISQFVRPASNNGPAEPGPDDITMAYNSPGEVASVLKRACYDCHSNHTNYPWYNNIQPVGWWLADHVNEGKEELNFSEFKGYKTKRKLRKLKEIVEQVSEGEMPLESYLWIHGEAQLSARDKELLTEWAKGLAQRITMEEGMAMQ